MKLNTVENVIERSGDLKDEENFTIALTAKAIEVLSSQIYKDAQKAIVRELGTNAADSHIEAGKKDVPFDVTLPNNMVPELVIRDYGTGMAYEKVMTMYRTYFGSDKTNSNEVTGCLGLGSKSPLAYTDQFQVTSWYNGEKSVYTIYKNEKGLPCINRIFHAASDEPTGVEVRISIKRYDFDAFRSKAIDTYKWFTPRPKIGGVSKLDWSEEAIAFESTDWKIRQDVQKKLTVVMGNVAYHVEHSDLQTVRSKLSHKAQVICDCNPIIHVNIGDVDIAASRETLKFDGNRTHSTLEKMLTRISKELVTKFESQIDSCATHWEARKLLRKLKNTQPLGSILPDKVKWKGIDVSTTIRLSKSDSFINKIGLSKHYCAERYAECKRYFMRSKERGYGFTLSTQTVDKIDVSEDAHVFIIEGKSHISKVSHFVRSGGEKRSAYVLTPATGTPASYLKDGTLDYPETKAFTLEEFFKNEHLEGIVQKTEDLPTPPKNLPENRTPVAHVLSPIQHVSRYDNKYWREREVDFDAGGIYVRVKGNHWNTNNMSDRRASELYDYHPVVHGKDVVGIRMKMYEQFDNAPQWKLVDDYIVEQYKDNIAAKEAARKQELWNRIESHSYSDFQKLDDITSFRPQHKDGLFVEVCNLFAEMEKQSNNDLANAYKIALPFLRTPLDIEKEYEDAKKVYNSFMKRYPLLDDIDNWSINEMREKILHYVGLIDGIKLHKKKRKSKRRMQFA